MAAAVPLRLPDVDLTAAEMLAGLVNQFDDTGRALVAALQAEPRPGDEEEPR